MTHAVIEFGSKTLWAQEKLGRNLNLNRNPVKKSDDEMTIMSKITSKKSARYPLTLCKWGPAASGEKRQRVRESETLPGIAQSL